MTGSTAWFNEFINAFIDFFQGLFGGYGEGSNWKDQFEVAQDSFSSVENGWVNQFKHIMENFLNFLPGSFPKS
ncbi:MAG: hypothetical protein LBN05_07735 [Oscillospiraceae bacterium]|jgi:hypothetical protein|nr:hypothetical protein [Oscillospiraceae bacterium]